eukprot:s851_g7.t1
MDPTEEELNAMTSLEHVADWAGLEAGLRQNLIRDLGTPTKLRDIVFITRPVWDAAVVLLRVTVPPATAGAEPTERELTPVEKSRVEIFRRVVMLRMQLTPDTPGDPGVTRPGINTAPSQSSSPVSKGSPTRKIKLSVVIDPTLDSEVVQLGQSAVTAMYSKYKQRFGDHPSPEVEPSIDQLSALAQLIKAGATPYVDMSIWGPHALRTLRKAVFKSYVLNAATGEWSKKETPGPESLVSWEKSFKTFKVAMVLLEACDPERLEAYLEHVKEFHNRFGASCWGILYRADTRMRSEYMERIRRSLEDSPKHGFTSADPWAAVYAEAVRDQDFWTREVVTPSTLLLARSKSHAVGLSSDSSIESVERSPAPKRKKSTSPKGASAPKRKGGEERPPSPEGPPPKKAKSKPGPEKEGQDSASYAGIRLVAKADRSPLQRKKRKPVAKTNPKSTSNEIPKQPAWHEFKYGATNVSPELWDGRPRALLLFSGKPRDGDVASYLAAAGWIVVVVDIVGPVPCDVLKPQNYRAILKDVQDGLYDCTGVATPCETLSPLREKQPGPKPLRSLQHPEGLSKKNLSKAEQTQLSEANSMFDLSADVVKYQLRAHRAFWLENPDHGDKLDFWKTSWGQGIEKHALVDKVAFDQCRVGAEVTKPTKIAHFAMDLSELQGLRCDHQLQTWKRQDGSEYQAKHESLVQRWRDVREKEKEIEDREALGGMRNPRLSADKIPKSLIAGQAIHELLLEAAGHQETMRLTKALLSGQKAEPMDPRFIGKLRKLVVDLLAPDGVWLPEKTTKAATPISPEVLWAWGEFTRPGRQNFMASWLRTAPGVFRTHPKLWSISSSPWPSLGRGDGSYFVQADGGLEEPPIC